MIIVDDRADAKSSAKAKTVCIEMRNRMNDLHTIGHSSHPIDYFLEMLKAYGINCLADVRSIPFSKYAPQYNTKELEQHLNSKQIYYIYMGKEFGARKNDRQLFTDGYVDFEKVIKDAHFQKGVERIEKGLDQNYKIAFMCAEKDPFDCHRCLMVARAFNELGHNIINIREDGNYETQEQIKDRLLDMYFPAKNQLFLEFAPKKNTPELISEAYLLRNREIAYKRGKE